MEFMKIPEIISLLPFLPQSWENAKQSNNWWENEVKKVARLIFSALLIGIFLIGNPTPSSAKMYKYKDENGKLHFTDDPTKVPEKYRKYKKS